MRAESTQPASWGHHLRPRVTSDHVPAFCLQRRNGRPCWQKVTHVWLYRYEIKTKTKTATRRIGLYDEHAAEFVDRHHLIIREDGSA